jgi:hypothetical protein
LPRRREPLCSIDVGVPTQLLAASVWDLHAYVWFPPQEEIFPIEGGYVMLRFGFREADLQLRIRCALGETRIFGHSEVETATVTSTIRDENVQATSGGGEVKGSLKLPFVAAVSGNAGAKREGKSTQVTDTINTQRRYILESIDYDTWRMHGHQYPHGILTGRVVNQEPLCQVEHRNRPQVLETIVTARTTSLFVGSVDADGKMNETSASHNRHAVISAIIARSLRTNESQSGVGKFILEKHKATLQPKEP